MYRRAFVEHSDVWMDAMRLEFDGLETAGTLVEVSKLPADSNVVEPEWKRMKC